MCVHFSHISKICNPWHANLVQLWFYVLFIFSFGSFLTEGELELLCIILSSISCVTNINCTSDSNSCCAKSLSGIHHMISMVVCKAEALNSLSLSLWVFVSFLLSKLAPVCWFVSNLSLLSVRVLALPWISRRIELLSPPLRVTSSVKGLREEGLRPRGPFFSTAGPSLLYNTPLRALQLWSPSLLHFISLLHLLLCTIVTKMTQCSHRSITA